MSDLRASDADRNRTVDALRRHHLAGRLDVEEFEDRVARAEQALMLADLEALLRDLEWRDAQRHPVTTGRPRFPGNREFVERKVLDAPVASVNARLLDVLVPQLERYGYTLTDEKPGSYVLTYRYRARWALPVAILAFPIGLLALGQWYEDRITIRTSAVAGGRTALLVHGRAPLAVRRAFAEIDA